MTIRGEDQECGPGLIPQEQDGEPRRSPPSLDPPTRVEGAQVGLDRIFKRFIALLAVQSVVSAADSMLKCSLDEQFEANPH